MRLRDLLEDDTNLDRADLWLKTYTYENADKWPSSDVLETLLERYPVNENTTVYRGLNFLTKEEYEDFAESIKSGYIISSSISSWSESKQEAETFAVTRPTYFLNHELMQAEAEKRRNHEKITGYRGVIISVNDIIGKGIDVNASKLGHESEIILVPGEYKISSIEEIKTFKDTIEKANVERNILSLERKNVYGNDKQLFQYIMKNHKDDLTDKAKEHLYNITKPNSDLIEFEKQKRFGKGNEMETTVTVYVPSSFLDFAKQGLFTKSDTSKAMKIASETLDLFIKELPKYEGMTVNASEVGEIADSIGKSNVYTTAMRNHIHSTKNEIDNSVKDINRISDPNKKKQAIKDYTDKMIKMISQI